MRHLILFAAVPLCALALPASVVAQDNQAKPPCIPHAETPDPFPAWRNHMPVKAGGTAAKAPALTPGQAVTLALLPTRAVTYPVRPAKPGGSVSFGGLAQFTVAKAGTWRIALASGAWVDVVRDGKAAPSIAHGHGPDCSAVRKLVDYALTPGRYALQVAANGTSTLDLLVTPLP